MTHILQGPRSAVKLQNLRKDAHMITNARPDLLYAKAYDAIMHNQHTTASEKLILIELCRWRPCAYRGSNATISYNTGLSVRAVQYGLKSLSMGAKKRDARGLTPRRAYIAKHSSPRVEGMPLWTCRIIVPICLPGRWVSPPPLVKKGTRQPNVTGVQKYDNRGARIAP